MDFLKTLGILLLGLLAMAAFFGLICLCVWLYQFLPDYTIAIVFGILLVVANIVAYFESYIWNSRKRWYFPLCLATTFCAVVIALCIILG